MGIFDRGGEGDALLLEAYRQKRVDREEERKARAEAAQSLRRRASRSSSAAAFWCLLWERVVWALYKRLGLEAPVVRRTHRWAAGKRARAQSRFEEEEYARENAL